jgi:hypothetical protein
VEKKVKQGRKNGKERVRHNLKYNWSGSHLKSWSTAESKYKNLLGRSGKGWACLGT